jgi:hypothetical protein
LAWQRSTIQSRRQGLALNVLEDQVIHVALAADVVEAADVRMCQRGGGARFVHETFPQQGIAGGLVANHLDRDDPIEATIARAVDLAHPAGADGRQNLVWAELSTNLEHHERSALYRRFPIPGSLRAIGLRVVQLS